MKQLLFIIILIATSCVPISQLQQVENQNQNQQKQITKLTTQNQNLKTNNIELGTQVEDQNQLIDNLEQEIYKLENNYRQITTKHQKTIEENQKILTQQKELSHQQATEINSILQQLQNTQTDLQHQQDNISQIRNKLLNKEQDISTLQTEIGKKDQQLISKNTELTKKNQRLVELENLLYKRDSASNQLKTEIQKALVGFQQQDLQVHKKNGKIYVSLQEKMLFQQGKYDVSAQAIQAIKQLGKILEQNPNINITIEGHTDDIPYKPNSIIQDNWDLSTKRATQIIRAILQHTKIAPERITASGRAEYEPINSEKTAQARTLNRRTEIILTPKLDQILELIENN